MFDISVESTPLIWANQQWLFDCESKYDQNNTWSMFQKAVRFKFRAWCKTNISDIPFYFGKGYATKLFRLLGPDNTWKNGPCGAKAWKYFCQTWKHLRARILAISRLLWWRHFQSFWRYSRVLDRMNCPDLYKKDGHGPWAFISFTEEYVQYHKHPYRHNSKSISRIRTNYEVQTPQIVPEDRSEDGREILRSLQKYVKWQALDNCPWIQVFNTYWSWILQFGSLKDELRD